MKAFFAIMSLFPIALAHAEEKLNYDDHILPIFEKSCMNCHNPDDKKGDLDLSTYSGFLTGSSGGKIASPGDGAGSKIFNTATHSEEPFMPPKGKGDKLDKKDLMVIRQWIDEGLLETKDSTAKIDNTPKIDFSKIKMNPSGGPAPLPVNLSLEPVISPIIAGVIPDIECSPTAPVLAITSQQQILLFHTETLELIGVIPFPQSKQGVMNPESLSFHPEGKFLLAGGGVAGKSGLTVCWDVTTGETIMTVAREYDTVIASSLRKDLKGVATGGPSRRVKLWDASSNALEFNHKKHTDWVTCLSYSHDGVLLASGCRAGGVWVWEAHSGNEFHKLAGHNARIVAMKWSPDSNFLATASEDGSLRIWNMQEGNEVKKIDAHSGGILDMDWSGTGEFVTVGRDGFIKIWKSDYGLKKQFHHKTDLPLKAEWSHDSKRVFIADYQGNISVWDGELKSIGNIAANPKSLADRIRAYEDVVAFQQMELTKVEDKIASAEQRIQVVLNDIKHAEQELLKNQEATKLAQQNQSNAEASLREQQQQIPKIQEEIKKADAEAKTFSTPEQVEQLKTVQTKIQQFNEQIVKTQNDVKSSQANIQKFKEEINQRRGQDKPLMDKINHHKNELPKAQQERDQIKTTSEPMKVELDQIKLKAEKLRVHLKGKPGAQ